MNKNMISMDLEEEEAAAPTGKRNSRRHLAPLFVYEILKNCSNPRRRLTQSEIIRRLDAYPYALSIRVTSHQLFQQLIGSLPAMIDCSPGQAQLFADLPICQLQEPVHQKDIPEALGQNGQRVSQPVVLNEDHITVHREGCVYSHG